MAKPLFNPAERLKSFAASLPDEVRDLLADLVAPDTPLEALPGGASLLELMEQVAEPMSLQLRLFSDTLGVGHFHSRAFIFEPEVTDGKRHWVANPPRFADPDCFTTDPDDLLAALAAWQSAIAPEGESVALWFHGVEVGEKSLFLVLARHSEGTLAQFMARDGAWARAPLGAASLRRVVQMELRKTSRARDFWASAVSSLTLELAETRSPALSRVLKGLGIAAELTSEQAVELVQSLLAHEGGLRAVQGLCRKVAHSPLMEAQELLEVLAGLLEQTSKAIQDQVAKSRKEQATALRRLQSSLERQRILYEGIKQRADRLSQENLRLRKAPSAAAPARSTDQPLHISTARLLDGC